MESALKNFTSCCFADLKQFKEIHFISSNMFFYYYYLFYKRDLTQVADKLHIINATHKTLYKYPQQKTVVLYKETNHVFTTMILPSKLTIDVDFFHFQDVI